MTTTTITPHVTFTFTRADEIAECWDGIPKELYAKLIEAIMLDHENLAAHWSKLTPAEQRQLNDLAEAEARQARTWTLNWSNENEDDGYKPRGGR